MLRRVFLVVKYIFENGPNAVFWVGVLLLGVSWYKSSGLSYLLPVIVLVCLAIFGITLFIRKTYKDVKKEVLNTGAKAAVGGSVIVTDDAINDLKNAIPSNSSLKLLYGYAEDYARNWAPDGELLKVTYYIELKEGKVKNLAQIFIYSKKRGEELTTYFPKMSDKITEKGESERYGFGENIQRLYSHPKWRDELEAAIEKFSSDIAKADEIGIQISTYSDGLSFNFTFRLQSREWFRKWTYKK